MEDLVKRQNNSAQSIGEIHVGNHFFCEGHKILISGVHISGRVEYVRLADNSVHETNDLFSITGIEIPKYEEDDEFKGLVFGSGFDRIRAYSYRIISGDQVIELQYSYSMSGWYLYMRYQDTKVTLPITYIHQMQNFFFLLTNKKLQFKYH